MYLSKIRNYCITVNITHEFARYHYTPKRSHTHHHIQATEGKTLAKLTYITRNMDTLNFRTILQSYPSHQNTNFNTTQLYSVIYRIAILI
jgi:hypothetical protein